ncbi:hypothetical protein [Spirosoma litoris]
MRRFITATAGRWKQAYEGSGKAGLITNKPCPENPKLRTPPEIEELILRL